MFKMMIGLPGSGKSYLANQLLEQDSNLVLLSSDSIRKELYGSENEQGNPNDVFTVMHERLEENIKNGKSVLYDACNISYKRRIEVLNQLKKFNVVKECIVLATPYEKCVENNNKRERSVPEDVIMRMYTNFFFPQYFEGWDNIYLKYNDEGFEYNLTEYLETLKDFDQMSPYHTLTLGWHIQKVFDYLSTHDADDLLLFSSLLHDIGKPDSQTFKEIEEDGVKKIVAHYYQHENISAYLCMFYLKNLEMEYLDKFKIIKYVQWHMLGHKLKEMKSMTRNKYINLLGQDIVDDLILFNKADSSAK